MKQKAPTRIAIRGRAVLVGDSGEYYVVAELLRRGVVAGLTARNSPHFDAFATDGMRTVNLRIKSKSSHSRDWQWTMNDNHEIYANIGPQDYTVLVALRESSEAPEYYVLPTRHLVRRIRNAHLKWLTHHGGVRPKNPLSRHTALSENRNEKFLSNHKSRWDLLGLRFK